MAIFASGGDAYLCMAAVNSMADYRRLRRRRGISSVRRSSVRRRALSACFTRQRRRYRRRLLAAVYCGDAARYSRYDEEIVGQCLATISRDIDANNAHRNRLHAHHHRLTQASPCCLDHKETWRRFATCFSCDDRRIFSP